MNAHEHAPKTQTHRRNVQPVRKDDGYQPTHRADPDSEHVTDLPNPLPRRIITPRKTNHDA